MDFIIFMLKVSTSNDFIESKAIIRYFYVVIESISYYKLVFQALLTKILVVVRSVIFANIIVFSIEKLASYSRFQLCWWMDFISNELSSFLHIHCTGISFVRFFEFFIPFSNFVSSSYHFRVANLSKKQKNKKVVLFKASSINQSFTVY